MNAKDYIYNALGESMNAVKDDLEGLSSYIDMDFDDYFGSLNSQIVEDENGTEVLSEIADEYVEGKVVCTAEEGREMFDAIKRGVFESIIYDILKHSETRERIIELLDFALQDEYSDPAYIVTGKNFVKELSEKINDGEKIIELKEDDFEIAEDTTSYNSIPVIGSYSDSDFGEMMGVVGYITPKNKSLKLRYSQTWQDNGTSEEDGISVELYNYAARNLNMSNADIPSFLGCTHVFETEDGDIYGFIEQK